MALYPELPNRRKFLERSALGVGSALFLPGLLTNCTDHRIPPDGNPWPPIDLDIDWNDDAKQLVVGALGLIPEAGGILSGLVSFLWPNTQVDIWGQIKAQVEALVDKKIADNVYQTVSEDLKGLNNSTQLYLQEVRNYNEAVKTQPKADPNDLRSQWITTRNLFVNALPHFQSKGYELLLLPLFAQFANMYLSILRDMVANGNEWGRINTDQTQDIADLQKAISDFSTYTNNTFNAEYISISGKTKPDTQTIEPFRTINVFVRSMTINVLDYMDTWPYYDVIKYPKGAKKADGTPINMLFRQVYSDPYGTITDSAPLTLAGLSFPTQGPTNLTVWGGSLIDAIQLTYPANSGPNGVTQTARMGGGGGTNQPPAGGSFTMSPNNPIVQVRVAWGSVVNALQFRFYDGTTTNILGRQDTGFDTPVAYSSRFLSYIHVNGISRFYGTGDSAVFGFLSWTPPAAALRALRTMYITSPKEHSVAELAQAFPTLGLSATPITDELKAARQAYWAALQARAKALK
jgi:hypothetical protein